jgi:rhomboid protease GluP
LVYLDPRTHRIMNYARIFPKQVGTPVTNSLLLINFAVFAIELWWKTRHSSELMPTAIRHLKGEILDRDLMHSFFTWGALFPEAVISGEWLRLISANFLHAGLLHLGMNLLGLSFLGKFIEQRLGTFKMAIAYIVTGLGSMCTIVYLDRLYPSNPPTATVGASGAIMGLLGVMGAMYLIGWFRGIKSAGQQLRQIMFAIGLQLVFDFTSGYTSIVGHYSGLTIGFVLGLLLSF